MNVRRQILNSRKAKNRANKQYRKAQKKLEVLIGKSNNAFRIWWAYSQFDNTEERLRRADSAAMNRSLYYVSSGEYRYTAIKYKSTVRFAEYLEYLYPDWKEILATSPRNKGR